MERVAPDSAPKAAPTRTIVLCRAITFLAVGLMSGLVGSHVPKLWREYRGLERERREEQSSRVVTYLNIVPSTSYASAPPSGWLHDEGDEARLWGGWDRKAQSHRWFRAAKGDLDRARLRSLSGRETAPAIETSILEGPGGDFWDQIPPVHRVFACALGESTFACPQALLKKVLVVNAEGRPRPALAILSLSAGGGEDGADVFDPVAGGRRFTMGHTGYLMDGKVLLHDRGEGNLWLADEQGLRALAGPSKGTVLPRLARMESSSWGDVRAAHPQLTLLVGSAPPPRPATR